MIPNKLKTLEFFELIKGRYPAKDDLGTIRDSATRDRLELRLLRAQTGNYGQHRRFADFIELIADFGPGHRIYLGEDGPVLIIILVVGDKSTQTSDFKEARAYWDAYKARKGKGPRHGRP